MRCRCVHSGSCCLATSPFFFGLHVYHGYAATSPCSQSITLMQHSPTLICSEEPAIECHHIIRVYHIMTTLMTLL